jgi:comEA protein
MRGKVPSFAIRCFFLCVLLSAFCFQVSEAKKKPPEHPINLNTASAAQLEEVPGIGPVTAEKILKMRKTYGPFKSVDDLRAIKGIGPKRLEKMRKYLTVGKPPSKSGSKAVAKSPPTVSKPSP